jgi:hypothetical protein
MTLASTMKNPDFLICAPLHSAHSSNGVLGLFHLAKTLEKLGRTAYMCQIDGADDDSVYAGDLTKHGSTNANDKHCVRLALQNAATYGAKLLTDFSRERIDASYVIYPETVLDNPLRARNVVRYFGNRDGALKNGAKVKRGASDFLLGHSRALTPEAHHVCCFAWMNPLFNRDGSQTPLRRTLDLSYIGKGALSGFVGHVKNTVTIGRHWPESKEELAVLLRQCRFFYTADACSNINNEALSCGAIPVFVHNGPWSDAEIDAFEAGAIPRLRQNENFNDAQSVQFEIRRAAYLAALSGMEQRWEPSVRELIGKVDRHFESRRVAAAIRCPDTGGPPMAFRPKQSTIDPVQHVSRKERKRWNKQIERLLPPTGGAPPGNLV